MKKLFIGGFGGCGSRVIMEILKKSDYYIGSNNNAAHDFVGRDGREFMSLFNELFFKKDYKQLKMLLHDELKDKESWAIKHGPLMFMIDLLKEWYPDSEFIYVMRNPVANMLNTFKTYNVYGGLDLTCSLEDKVNYHIDKSLESIEKSDYVVKLEDLCLNTNDTVKKFLNFIEIDVGEDISYYTSHIKIPKSLGRGEMYYNDFKQIEKLGY